MHADGTNTAAATTEVVAVADAVAVALADREDINTVLAEVVAEAVELAAAVIKVAEAVAFEDDKSICLEGIWVDVAKAVAVVVDDAVREINVQEDELDGEEYPVGHTVHKEAPAVE